MGGENRREIVPRALSSPPQYASARRGTSSNATPLKQTAVFHCFYLVLVTMQFSTADEASVSAAIHSSKFMSVNP